MTEVSNLGKRYGSLQAVQGVSFSTGPGEVVGLLYPNGAGKTAIVKILTCYMFPSFAAARINDWDIFDSPLEIKKLVGYLPENAPLYTDLNVLEYLSFMAGSRSLKGKQKNERIERAVEECGLKEVVYRGIDTISKGFRQRTGLAQGAIGRDS